MKLITRGEHVTESSLTVKPNAYQQTLAGTCLHATSSLVQPQMLFRFTTKPSTHDAHASDALCFPNTPNLVPYVPNNSPQSSNFTPRILPQSIRTRDAIKPDAPTLGEHAPLASV